LLLFVDLLICIRKLKINEYFLGGKLVMMKEMKFRKIEKLTSFFSSGKFVRRKTLEKLLQIYVALIV
jgi:hypothetical protein